jgi:hypothetical protein
MARPLPRWAAETVLAARAVRRDHRAADKRGRQMIEIAAAKVVEVVFLAREGRAGAGQLAGLIEALNEDEAAHLTAIAWVGRGSFEPEDYTEAVRTARSQASTPTATYLMGMTDLAENLEAGLEALGVDVTGEEEDLL